MKCKTHFSTCSGTIVLTLIISFQLKAPLKTLTELEGSFFHSSSMNSWISMDYWDVQVVIKKKSKPNIRALAFITQEPAPLQESSQGTTNQKRLKTIRQADLWHSEQPEPGGGQTGHLSSAPGTSNSGTSLSSEQPAILRFLKPLRCKNS